MHLAMMLMAEQQCVRVRANLNAGRVGIGAREAQYLVKYRAPDGGIHFKGVRRNTCMDMQFKNIQLVSQSAVLDMVH
jgi:hypothetical protein